MGSQQVSLALAVYDEFAIQFIDEEHSGGKKRFLLPDISTAVQLLLVCHCERDSGNVIRIISARRATKRESTFYGSEKNHEVEYDLSKMKSRRNSYQSKLKKPVTMRLSEDVISYFKSMADQAGVPYRSLINLYLRDCVTQYGQVKIAWPVKP